MYLLFQKGCKLNSQNTSLQVLTGSFNALSMLLLKKNFFLAPIEATWGRLNEVSFGLRICVLIPFPTLSGCMTWPVTPVFLFSSVRQEQCLQGRDVGGSVY